MVISRTAWVPSENPTIISKIQAEMETTERNPANVYLNGLGLGSIAAAMYLIQKADFHPTNIHIFEQKGDRDLVGGSCDASKKIVNDQTAYFMQGSRMFEDMRCN
jgi:oleate hydratase